MTAQGAKVKSVGEILWGLESPSHGGMLLFRRLPSLRHEEQPLVMPNYDGTKENFNAMAIPFVYCLLRVRRFDGRDAKVATS